MATLKRSKPDGGLGGTAPEPRASLSKDTIASQSPAASRRRIEPCEKPAGESTSQAGAGTTPGSALDSSDCASRSRDHTRSSVSGDVGTMLSDAGAMQSSADHRRASFESLTHEVQDTLKSIALAAAEERGSSIILAGLVQPERGGSTGSEQHNSVGLCPLPRGLTPLEERALRLSTSMRDLMGSPLWPANFCPVVDPARETSARFLCSSDCSSDGIVDLSSDSALACEVDQTVPEPAPIGPQWSQETSAVNRYQETNLTVSQAASPAASQSAPAAYKPTNPWTVLRTVLTRSGRGPVNTPFGTVFVDATVFGDGFFGSGLLLSSVIFNCTNGLALAGCPSNLDTIAMLSAFTAEDLARLEGTPVNGSARSNSRAVEMEGTFVLVFGYTQGALRAQVRHTRIALDVCFPNFGAVETAAAKTTSGVLKGCFCTMLCGSDCPRASVERLKSVTQPARRSRAQQQPVSSSQSTAHQQPAAPVQQPAQPQPATQAQIRPAAQSQGAVQTPSQSSEQQQRVTPFQPASQQQRVTPSQPVSQQQRVTPSQPVSQQQSAIPQQQGPQRQPVAQPQQTVQAQSRSQPEVAQPQRATTSQTTAQQPPAVGLAAQSTVQPRQGATQTGTQPLQGAQAQQAAQAQRNSQVQQGAQAEQGGQARRDVPAPAQGVTMATQQLAGLPQVALPSPTTLEPFELDMAAIGRHFVAAWQSNISTPHGVLYVDAIDTLDTMGNHNLIVRGEARVVVSGCIDDLGLLLRLGGVTVEDMTNYISRSNNGRGYITPLQLRIDRSSVKLFTPRALPRSMRVYAFSEEALKLDLESVRIALEDWFPTGSGVTIGQTEVVTLTCDDAIASGHVCPNIYAAQLNGIDRTDQSMSRLGVVPRIERLRTESIPTNEEAVSMGSCPICLERYQTGMRLRILPCGHRIHRDCFDDYALTVGALRCPLHNSLVYIYGARVA